MVEGSRRQLLLATGAAATSWGAGCAGLFESSEGGIRSAGLGTYRQFQYDAENTGSVAASGVDGEPSEQWRFQRAPDDPTYSISSPVVAEGTVFVCEGGTAEDTTQVTAYGLDPATGDQHWSNTVVAGYDGAESMAYVDGTVVVHADTYYGLDPADGTLRWTYPGDGIPWHEPTVADGSLYTVVRTHSRAALVAIDPENGRERWRTPTERTSRTHTAASEDGIYVGGSDLSAYSYDGSPRWSAGLEHEVAAAPTVGENAIYAAGSERTVSAVLPDGEVRWQRQVEQSDKRQGSGPISTSPVLVDETLYVDYGGRITALNVADGSLRWESDVYGSNHTVAGGGTLYVSSLTRLHAVDRGNGIRQWSVSTNASRGTRSTPVVVDGAIFFPSEGLHAYA